MSTMAPQIDTYQKQELDCDSIDWKWTFESFVLLNSFYQS